MRKIKGFLDFTDRINFTLSIFSCGYKKGDAIADSFSDIRFAEITRAKIAYKTYGTAEPLFLFTDNASNMV